MNQYAAKQIALAARMETGRRRTRRAEGGAPMLYQYPGRLNCYSKCDLEIIRGRSTTLVICSERADNPGTSVTNAAARIATCLCHDDRSIAPKGLLWVEHTPALGRGRQRKPERWCRVTLTARDGRTFDRPAWEPIPAEDVQALRQRIEASRPAHH